MSSALPRISLNYYEEDELAALLRNAIQRGDGRLAVEAAVELSTLMPPATVIQTHLLPAALDYVGPAVPNVLTGVMSACDSSLVHTDRQDRIRELRGLVCSLAVYPKSVFYRQLEDWCELFVTQPPWTSYRAEFSILTLIDSLFEFALRPKPPVALAAHETRDPDVNLFSLGLAVLVLALRDSDAFQKLSDEVVTRLLKHMPSLRTFWCALAAARVRNHTHLVVRLWIIILIHLDPLGAKFTRVMFAENMPLPSSSSSSSSSSSAASASSSSSSSSSRTPSGQRALAIPDWALDFTTRRGRGYCTLDSLWVATLGGISEWKKAEILKSHGPGVGTPPSYAQVSLITNHARLELAMSSRDKLEEHAARRYTSSVSELVIASPRSLAPPMQPCEITCAEVLSSLSLLSPMLRTAAQNEHLRLLSQYEAWVVTSEFKHATDTTCLRTSSSSEHWFERRCAAWLDRRLTWTATSVATAAAPAAPAASSSSSSSSSAPPYTFPCMSVVASPHSSFFERKLNPPSSSPYTLARSPPSTPPKRPGDTLESDRAKRMRTEPAPAAVSPVPGARVVSREEFKQKTAGSVHLISSNDLKLMSAPNISWLPREKALLQGPFRTAGEPSQKAIKDSVHQHSVLNGSDVSLITMADPPHSAFILIRGTRLSPEIEASGCIPLEKLSQKQVQQHAKLILRSLILRCVLNPPVPHSAMSQLVLVTRPSNPSDAVIVHGGMGSRLQPPAQTVFTGLARLARTDRASVLFAHLEDAVRRASPPLSLGELFDLDSTSHSSDIEVDSVMVEAAAGIIAELCPES